MSVLLPHSVWIESQAPLAIPIVLTPKLEMSVQLRVIWPLVSWSQKFHLSRVGVVEYIGVAVGVDSGVVDDSVGSGFSIVPLI